MKIKENKNLLVVGAVLIVCLILIGFSGSIQGGERSHKRGYEIRPEITLPEYQTDTTRAIDAYERVMDNFIIMTETNLAGINTDIKEIAKQLVSIDRKLTKLSTRMGRIEKALGIKATESQAEKRSEAKASTCPGKAK